MGDGVDTSGDEGMYEDVRLELSGELETVLLPELLPPRPSFLAFILLFWNQILTCLSVSPKVAANSSLLGLQRYLL